MECYSQREKLALMIPTLTSAGENKMLRTENIFKEEGGNQKLQASFLLSVLHIDQNPHKGICCNM